MDRVVYNLMDISDNCTLRHLMVSLPPSVAPLLKYYYDIFDHNFKFDGTAS